MIKTIGAILLGIGLTGLLVMIMAWAHQADADNCAELGVELEARTKYVRGHCYVLPVSEV